LAADTRKLAIKFVKSSDVENGLSSGDGAANHQWL